MNGTRVLTLVASDVAPIGGMERAAYEVCGRLLERGWEITVIARTCALTPRPELRHVRLLRPDRPHTLSATADLVHGAWALRRHGRGVLWTNNPVVPSRVDVITAQFCEHGYRARRGVSRSRRSQPLFLLNSWAASRIALATEWWCYRPGRVGRVIAASRGVAGEIVAAFPAIGPQVDSIPNGVDLEAFARREGAREQARAGFGLPADAPVAAFVGGDWARKGLDVALEGLASAPGWHLLVAGDGDRKAFGARAERLGAAARVHFAGHLPDPRPAYWAADALLLPTAYEAFSLVTLEAAAAGLALVVPQINGTEELVEHGVNGWFTAADGEAIAARLRTLDGDRAGLAQAGAAARRSSLRYGWDHIVDAYEAVFAQLTA